MEFRFAPFLISIVVAVVLFATMLVPIINDSLTTERTFTNDGFYRMTNTEEETVITWTPSVDKFVLNVNGEDVSIQGLTQYGYSNYSIAFADDVVVRYYYETANSQNIQVWKGDYQVGMGASSTYTMTITINSSALTFNNGAPDAVTSTIAHTGDYFVIDPNGEYTMKLRDKSAYILEDSTIFYAGGISGVGTSIFSSIYIEGTVADYTVTPMRNYVTVSNESATYSSVNGYVGLVALDKLTFDTTYSPPGGTEAERSQAYNYFLVPYQVTAELSQHLDDTEQTLVGIIPLLVIIGLVIGVVAIVAVRSERF